jgi:predicted transposase/invertase (TIGR01784 family)
MDTAIEEGRAEGRAEGLVKGREEGLAEGLAQGRSAAMVEIARTMLAAGMKPEEVSRITGLSTDQIDELRIDRR